MAKGTKISGADLCLKWGFSVSNQSNGLSVGSISS